MIVTTTYPALAAVLSAFDEWTDEELGFRTHEDRQALVSFLQETLDAMERTNATGIVDVDIPGWAVLPMLWVVTREMRKRHDALRAASEMGLSNELRLQADLCDLHLNLRRAVLHGGYAKEV
jgi:hypothetical protein